LFLLCLAMFLPKKIPDALFRRLWEWQPKPDLKLL
jgi:hypothetical protein